MKLKFILITLVILMLPLAIATEITGELNTAPDFYQVESDQEEDSQQDILPEEPTSAPSNGGGGGGNSGGTDSATIITTPTEEVAPLFEEIKEDEASVAEEIQEEVEVTKEEKKYLWLIPIAIALIALIVFLIVYYLKKRKLNLGKK